MKKPIFPILIIFLIIISGCTIKLSTTGLTALETNSTPEDDIKNLKLEIESLKQQLNETSTEKETETKSEQEVLECVEKVNNARLKIEDLKKVIPTAMEELVSSYHETDNIISIQTDQNEAKRDLDAAKDRLSNLTSANASNTTIQNARDDVADLQTEYDELKTELDAENEEHRIKTQELDSRLKDLKNQLQDVKSLLLNTEQECSIEHLPEQTTCNAEKSSLETQTESLKSSIDSKKTEIRELKEERNDLRTSNAPRSEIDSLDDDILKEEAELVSLESIYDVYKKEFDDLKAECP